MINVSEWRSRETVLYLVMLSEHGLSAEMCDEEPATQPLNSQKEKLPSARRNFFLELPSV